MTQFKTELFVLFVMLLQFFVVVLKAGFSLIVEQRCFSCVSFVISCVFLLVVTFSTLLFDCVHF